MRPVRSIEGTTVERGDAAAGLLDQQHASGDVPRVEALLPEAVHAPAGDVADVERGRAEPAHGAGFAEKRGEQPTSSVIFSWTAYGKPVTSSASMSVWVCDTWSRVPLRNAPLPRSAVNNSSRVGSYTAPTSSRPSTSSATVQQNSGSPCAKLVVPSSGSTIQQNRERVSRRWARPSPRPARRDRDAARRRARESCARRPGRLP